MSQTKDKVRYTIDLDADEWQMLDEYTKRAGVPKSAVIREALRGYFQKNYIDLSKITLEHFEATMYIFERVVEVLTKFAKVMLKAGKLARIEADWESFEKLATLVKTYSSKNKEKKDKGKEEPSLFDLINWFLAMKSGQIPSQVSSQVSSETQAVNQNVTENA